MGWPETDHPIKYFATANESDTGVVVKKRRSAHWPRLEERFRSTLD
jgi:hypothetical protein